MPIDFGATAVLIGGAAVRVHLFVATLGYSWRQAFPQERQSAWFDGIEGRCGALAGCRRRGCSTTRERWSIITTP
jgi:hypothetical protein